MLSCWLTHANEATAKFLLFASSSSILTGLYLRLPLPSGCQVDPRVGGESGNRIRNDRVLFKRKGILLMGICYTLVHTLLFFNLAFISIIAISVGFEVSQYKSSAQDVIVSITY